jgi:hypothetical protein
LVDMTELGCQSVISDGSARDGDALRPTDAAASDTSSSADALLGDRARTPGDGGGEGEGHNQ